MDKQTFDEFAANIAKLLFSKNSANYNLAFTFTLSAGVDVKPFLKAVADEYLRLIDLYLLAPDDPQIMEGAIIMNPTHLLYTLGKGRFITISVSCLYNRCISKSEIPTYRYNVYGYCSEGNFSIGLHSIGIIRHLSQTIANFLFEYLEFWKRYKRIPSDRWMRELYNRNDIVVTG